MPAQEIPWSAEFGLTTEVKFNEDKELLIGTINSITATRNCNVDKNNSETKSLYYKGARKDLRYAKSELRRRNINKISFRTKTATNKERNRSLTTSSRMREMLKLPYKEVTRRSCRRTFYTSTPS
eukprot:TRINITY_DN22526_c0_g1_i1.p1 TRINITY_DN22526_c0_g1~~TRINITY_DN22526_c0_g1_i1.p1  ORF type:complete len:125 (+),score=20.28 TRINITY_DN22526_c0_g1_i1:101-475(+)